MNIPLNVLAEAAECLQICTKADADNRHLKADEFVRVVRSSSNLSWHVEQIQKQINVEVQE